MKRIFPIINAVVAIGAGLVVLIGYFVDIQGMKEVRLLLFQWAVIVAGVAVLVGIWNLISVHRQKIRARKPGSIYSFVLLFFLFLSLLFSAAPNELEQVKALLLDGIIIPVEVSLMAVLAITLIYAAIRMLRTRTDLTTVLFLVTAFIVLLGIGPWPLLGQLPLISDVVRPFISNVLASGGARGILIGVALGTLTTGLRILLGVDRPYGGK